MSINIGAIAEQKKVNGLDFPLVITPAEDSNSAVDEGFQQWLEQHQGQLQQLLIKHGAVLFRGFPVNSPQQFETMLDQGKFANMPYVGGAAPRTQVTQTRIVTANESPASEKIPFHHEMAQVAQPPGYIFFYCQQAPEQGGATSILSSAQAYQCFKNINPEFADKIEQQGVRYVRTMPDTTDTTSAIGRSWRETFKVDTREQAEQKMADAGMAWQWLDDGSLTTQTATLPAIRLDEESQQKVFFNSIVAVYTGWNDARNDGKTAVVSDDGETMNAQVIEALVQQMDALCVNFKWQAGDVLWLNNYTVLHARQSFKGARRILAAIAYK